MSSKIMRGWRKAWAPASLLVGALVLGAFPAVADVVRINGTGAALGGLEAVAEAYAKAHPGSQVSILRPALGGGGSVKALQAGALDLAVSARPLKEEERAQGLVAQEYAKAPLVIAVAKGNQRIAGLTLAELADIYAGRTRTWHDGSPLRLILRQPSDADTLLLRAMSPEMDAAVAAALVRKGMVTAITDQESAELLEKTPGAIGTSSLALIVSEKRALRALPLNGVEPSLKAFADGRYPYAKTLYLVTGARLSEDARRFADFLRSPAGRAILQRNGYWVAEDR
jgi:phosphate transport system substrate-binding protein